MPPMLVRFAQERQLLARCSVVLSLAAICTITHVHAEGWLAGAAVPGARAAHSAVWTGREMIVWGGGIDGRFLNTGGRYLPADDTWQPTTTEGAPEPRWFHAAVWTGREMIVWGGRPNFEGIGHYNDGGRYNPETDTWRPISTQGAPVARSQCVAVWTGREMLIWGGTSDDGERNDGARYDPETDTWKPMSSASGLEPRMEPTGVWTGSELIVYGGMNLAFGGLSFANGARYRPITDTWTPLPTAYGLPGRTGHTAVWTGERMILWGGRQLPENSLLNNGAIFDAGLNQWSPIGGDPYLPGRTYHAAVWTGEEMIVWGGQDTGGNILNSGARWRPATGAWAATAGEGAADKRQFWRPDLGIWTGEAMIIAAGSDYPVSLDSTYLYYPQGEPPPKVCVPAPAGLAAWWSFDGNARDRVSGTELQLNGEPEYMTARVDRGLRFDGANTEANAGIAPAFDVGAEDGFSIETWIRPEQTYRQPLVEWERSAYAWGTHFWVGVGYPGSLYANIADVQGANHLITSAPGLVVPNTLQHVGMSYDKASGIVRFYVNGRKVTEELAGTFTPQTTSELLLGYRTGEEHFTGVLDEVSLYRRALSEGEFAAIYSASSAGKCGTNAPPPPTPCVPVPSGLVGWWRGEGNANDAMGHGDGAANPGVSYEAGVVGQAFRVDGVQGRIAVPDVEAFKLVEALTIEAWVKLTGRDSGLSIFMRGDDRPGLDPYFLGVGEGRIVFGISDESDADLVSAPLPMNQWKHVAGTFDASEGRLKIYLDGVLAGETNTSRRPARDLNPAFSPGLGIGNVSGSLINFPWDGWLDEVSLYNRALAGSEILAIYQAGAAGKCTATNPPPPPATTFDVSGDFSADTNPAGAWSYGYVTQLGGVFSPLTFAKGFAAENGVPISAWQQSDTTGPSVNRVMGNGVAVSEGGAFTAPSGTVYVWPGDPGVLGVIRFTVPEGGQGTYLLRTAVRPTFDGPTAGDTDFHVLRNGQEFFGRYLDPGAGTTYSNLWPLAAGDHVDFVVGHGADGSADHSSLKIEATLVRLTNAPPPSCAAAPTNLIAWWRAEGNAEDSTGAHPGTPLYGATFAPGRVGQAFSFDGLGSRISIPDSEAFQLTSLSFEGWIQVASYAPGLIFFRGDNRPGLDPYLMSMNPDGRLHWGINNAANESAAVDSPDVLPTGVWHHVAGVFHAPSGSLDLYVNGQRVAHTITTVLPLRELDPGSEPALGIGNHGGTFHNFPFHGLVDEWSLYARALSAGEVLAIYEADAAGKCVSTNPPPPPPPPPALVFDLSADFSLTANPAGPWSYGSLTALDGTFSLHSAFRTFNSDNGVPIAIWSSAIFQPPFVAKVLGPEVAVSDGARFTAPPGTIYFGPGADGSPLNFGVVRFTVPADAAGSYRLETAVQTVFDSTRSRDADFHVLRNGEALFTRFLDPNSSAEYSTTLPLAAGDRIDFVVGRGADGLTSDSGLKIRATLTLATNTPPPPPPPCVPAPSGLVGSWRGEGNANDSTGHGDGVANSGVSYEPGIVGQAFRIDGVQGRIAVPDAEAFKLVDALTIEAWVKLINRDSGLSLFMRGDDRPGLDPYFLGVDQGRITFGISDASDSDFVATPLPMNQWKHVAGTFDAGTGLLKVYLDGAPAAQKHTDRRPARDLDPAFSPGLGIGNVNGSWINFPWDGWLDEVSLYNRALTDGEILAIYQAGTAGKCLATNIPPPPLPTALYDLSAGFSPTFNPSGVWTYGYLPTLDGPFQPFGFNTSFTSENGVPIAEWALANGLPPGLAKVIGDQTAVSAGGAFTAPPGSVWIAPGTSNSPGVFGVARFTVPNGGSGFYRIESAVHSNFEGPLSADGEYHVLENGHEIFGDFLPPNSSSGYSNTMQLAVGDTIDFVVGRGADGLEPRSSLRIQARLARITNAPPPPPTNCVAAPASMVGWWRGEGDATDALGRHPGTLVGNVGFDQGMVGQGFHFDGSGGYVRIPNDNALDFTSELTLELWYKHEGLPGESYGLLSSRGTESGPVNFGLSVIPIGIGPYFNDPTVATGDDADQGGTFEASRYLPVPSSGVFHHLGVTFRQVNSEQVELKTFIDGALVRTKVLAARLGNSASDAAIVIGRSAEYGEEIFHGVIDEVALYRRALSAEELHGLWTARSAGRCMPPTSPPLNQLLAALNDTPSSLDTTLLRARLQAAGWSITRGNVRAAIHQLRVFQRGTLRRIGPTAPALAQQLLATSQQLIELLDPQGRRRWELAYLEGVPCRVTRVFRPTVGPLPAMIVEASAPPGSTCRLQRSLNLRDWSDLAAPTELSDGVHQAVDPSPEEAACFYRLIVEPEE